MAMAVTSACDDGRIYPDSNTPTQREGLTMKLTGHLTGTNSWADGYTVAVAAFDEESPYALITKNITGEGDVQIVMNAIPAEATQVELCIIDRLRTRIATIAQQNTASLGDTRDTLTMDVGTIDLGMMALLQQNVFTPRCAGCHGLSSHTAAGIDLTEGNTYNNIVGKPSKHIEGKNIVKPNNYDESVLGLMLDTNLTSTWGYDHQRADISDTWRKILKDWIENIEQ